MWPRRPKRPKVATSQYGSYLRGRVCAAGIGEDAEASLYASDDIPLAIRVAFAVGVSSKKRAPVLTERQVERAVRDRLDLSALVADVEGDDGTGTPPAAPPPAVVGVEETVRLQTTRWIGDPLPETVS